MLAFALFVLAADLIVALMLAGKLPTPRRAATAAAILVGLALFAGDARAQPAADPASEMYLAYIVTGDARSDRLSKAGLDALGDELRNRTAVEPAATRGVDPARDDLSPYPLIYWRAPDTPTRLSDAALANLDRYMRLGGMLFLDTRDSGRAPGPQRPAAIMLQGLDAPPLELVGGDHVLTKAFYLLRSFPGRYPNARIYAETPASAAARDGVAALMVGDGDWAAAWAGEVGDERQQELSLRFGINLVMIALTGNYKADQVHIPALLDRLGQAPEPRR